MLEPFLSERVDIAGALITSTIANVNRAKAAKAFSLEEFLVVRNMLKSEEVKSATPEQREALHLKTFILSMGGRVQ
jgi:hypothetical protein